VRTTRNAGVTWSRSNPLLPDRWVASSVRVNLAGGIARAVVPSLRPRADAQAVYYLQSANGTDWSAPQRVTALDNGYGYAREVGFVGRPIVMYWAWFDAGPHGLFVAVKGRTE
jgi:hypothetical protein